MGMSMRQLFIVLSIIAVLAVFVKAPHAQTVRLGTYSDLNILRKLRLNAAPYVDPELLKTTNIAYKFPINLGETEQGRFCEIVVSGQIILGLKQSNGDIVAKTPENAPCSDIDTWDDWVILSSSKTFEGQEGEPVVAWDSYIYIIPSRETDSSAKNIRNCPAENWCAYHRTVDRAWRHSPLKEITKDNVEQLSTAWFFIPGGDTGLQSTPLAVDGNLYVPTNPSTVWKLNGATGERIWAFMPEMEEAVGARSVYAHLRGVSIGDGRLYMGLADGRVVAIDETTAEIIWDRKLVDSQKNIAGFSGAGTFVNSDLLVIGQNSGEYPIQGRIFGLHPKTGHLKWTFYTTGRGDSEALATWSGDSWKYGGGGSWQPGTVDYTNNQILMGTSIPDATALQQGANLYTSSTIALNLDTGQLNWYFQEAPGDPYDYGASPGEYVLFEDDGRILVLHPSKNGFNHVHESKSGDPVSIYPTQRTQNWTTGFNLETGEFENTLWPKAGERTLVCPAIDGGHSWNAGTYNPHTGLHYRVVQEWCMWLTVTSEAGGTTVSVGTSQPVREPLSRVFMAAEWVGAHPPGEMAHGRISARSPVTGKLTWDKRYDIIPHSALMSTGSGLVFNGTMDGWAEALDADTGETLWRFNNGSGHIGGIISYEADGKQYIAMAVGHDRSAPGAVLALFEDQLINDQGSAALVAYALPSP